MHLLLVLPLTAVSVDGRVYVDAQACNGLRLWLENFDLVTLACRSTNQTAAPDDFGPIDAIPGFDRLRFVPLPVAFTPHRFALALPKVARTLRAAINDADSLHFAIGGLWGDWASVACLLAGNRPFAVWTDRVEHQVTAFSARNKSGVKRLYTTATAGMMKAYERVLIRRSSLGLFHGADCFAAYARHSRNPHLVHDVHLEPRAVTTRGNQTDIRIVYAGRVHAEKGVFDWIEAVTRASRRHSSIKATWLGDGPALEDARRLTRDTPRISFPGRVNHDAVAEALAGSDMFVFCHKTPESPRCLIEALICGTPIVGYDSPYPADLISENGGGVLTPRDDPKILAETILAVAGDRTKLQRLQDRATGDGRRFSPRGVFRHRSDLMVRHATMAAV